jgi:CheY-like chemotaxis protein
LPPRLRFLYALSGISMPKTILLIENDAPFAEEMSGALEAMGYQVRISSDGKDGLELAKDLNPDAIVLCVELPRLSGYSICNKLKKDEALRSIPLVLTSSEATEEVFDDHRKLKVRAEAYLIKPYVSATLLEKLAALIGLPDGGDAPAVAAAEPPPDDAAGGDEEVVSLEDELGLEPFAGEPGEELPTLDLDSLPDEPAAPVAGDGDLEEDLKLLDDAFDGLSAPAPKATPQRSPAITADEDGQASDLAIEKAMGVDRPVTSEDLEAASASLPEEDESSARADLGGLDDETELALGALGDASPPPVASAFEALDALGSVDEPPAAPSAPPASPVEAMAAGAAAVLATAGGAAADALGASSGIGSADLERLESELAEREAVLAARDASLRELKAKLREIESALGEKVAEAASHQARGDTLAAQAKKAEADTRSAREESRLAVEQARAAKTSADGAEERAASAAARLTAAESRCRAAELEAATQRRAAEQAAEADHEVERLGAELIALRRDADGARVEAERRAGELKRRIIELEAANAKNEERVVKAYLKIKGDEKVRDKARKALSIALQLLEEGLPAEPVGEKRPRPVPE